MAVSQDAKTALRAGEAADSEAAGGRQSFGVADAGQAAAQQEASPALQFGLMAFFTLTRAVHPRLIKNTQERGEDGSSRYRHIVLTVPLIECMVSMVIGTVLCLINGGPKLLFSVWKPRSMGIFFFLGFLYALGDFLELASLSALSGTLYQVLSQSKLLITAFFMWGIKGQRQSGLQWVMLTSLMFALLSCTLMKEINVAHRKLLQGDVSEKDAEAAEEKEFEAYMFGLSIVVAKVIISCLGGVVQDRCSKEQNHVPVYMQFVQMKVAWILVLFAFVAADGDFWEEGIWHGWDANTWGAVGSFAVKGWSSLYLLAILDSLLKNIGEAVTVPIAYFIDITLPMSSSDVYDFNTFSTVMVVFMSVMSYLLSKGVVAKAKLWENSQR